MANITQTGPQSYLDLQKENDIKQASKSRALNAKSNLLSEEQNKAYEYAQLFNQMADMYNPQVDITSPQAFKTETRDMGDYGQSMWDDPNLTGYAIQQWDNIRAKNQPGLVKAAAGIGKGAVLAGTTFASGTAGLLWGVISAVKDGQFSKVWDNEVTRACDEINNAAEQAMPNYYDYDEQEKSWTSNILTWNTIFDKIVKNAGFMVGAAYSGGIYTKAINVLGKLGKGAKLLSKAAAAKAGLEVTEEAVALGERAMQMASRGRATKAIVGSFFNAAAEASIEAVDRANTFEEEQYANIENKKQQDLDAAYEEYLTTKGTLTPIAQPDGTVQMVDLAEQKYQQRISEINEVASKAKDMVSERRASVGNSTFALNIAVLFPGDLYTYGKLYAGGWKSSRNIGKAKVKATKEAVKKAKDLAAKGDKRELKRLEELVQKAEKTGFQGLSAEEKEMVQLTKTHLLGNKTYATVKALGEPLKEGNEELAQEFAGQVSQIYNADLIDDYYTSSLHPDAQRQAVNYMSAIGKAWDSSYGDFKQWEQFFIGAVSGLFGSPTIGTSFNKTDQTWLGRNKFIGMSGGAYTQFRDAMKEREREQEVLDHANEAIKNPHFSEHMRHFIQQVHFDDKKKAAIFHDDKFEYENNETASVMSDIMWLSKVGRSDLMDNAVKNMEDWQEEDVSELHELTKKWVSGEMLFASEEKDQKEAAEHKIGDLKTRQKDLEDQIAALSQEQLASEAGQALVKQKQQIDSQVQQYESIISRNAETERSSDIKEISPFVKPDGTVMSAEEIKEDLKKRVNRFKEIRQAVQDTYAEIDMATGEAFTDEQMDTLTWYKTMMWDWQNRAGLILSDVSSLINGTDDEKIQSTINSLDAAISAIENLEDPTARENLEQNRIFMGGLKLNSVKYLQALKQVKSIMQGILDKSIDRKQAGLHLGALLNSKKKIKVDKTETKKKSDALPENAEDINLGEDTEEETKEEKKKEESKKKPEDSGEVEFGQALFDVLSQIIKQRSGDPNSESSLKVQTALRGLEDLRKIDKAYKKYNEKLREYWESPDKIEEEHKGIIRRTTEITTRAVDRAKNLNFDADRPIGQIAADLWSQRARIKEEGSDKFAERYKKKDRPKIKQAAEVVLLAQVLEENINEADTLESIHNDIGNKIISDHIKELVKVSNTTDEFYNNVSSQGIVLTKEEYDTLGISDPDLDTLNKELLTVCKNFVESSSVGDGPKEGTNWEDEFVPIKVPLKFQEDGKVVSDWVTQSFPQGDGEFLNIRARALGSTAKGTVVVQTQYQNDSGEWADLKIDTPNNPFAGVLDIDVPTLSKYLNSGEKVGGIISYQINGEIVKIRAYIGKGSVIDIRTTEIPLAEFLTQVPEGKQNFSEKETKEQNKSATKAAKEETSSSDPEYESRREISEMWLDYESRENGELYSQVLEDGRAPYPGYVDPKKTDDFLQFVKAVEQYLKEHGAHEFIKNRDTENIAKGQFVYFYRDEEWEEKTGQKAIFIGIKTSSGTQCIGQYANPMPFVSDAIQDKLNDVVQSLASLHSTPDYNDFLKGVEKIMRDPAYTDTEKLYIKRALIRQLTEDELIVPSKITGVFGGQINNTTTHHPLLEVTGGHVPQLAIVTSGAMGIQFSTVGDIKEEDIIKPKNMKPGQVYALMPANNGKYIACCCSFNPIRGIPKEDPYMQRILKVFADAMGHLKEDSALGRYKLALCNLLGLFPSNVHLNGYTKDGKNALVLKVTLDSGGEAVVFHTHITEGTTTDEIYSRFFAPDSKTFFGKTLSAWVSRKLLQQTDADGNLTEEAQDYAKMISNHLNVPINPDTGWHTVNDWFTVDDPYKVPEPPEGGESEEEEKKGSERRLSKKDIQSVLDPIINEAVNDMPDDPADEIEELLIQRIKNNPTLADVEKQAIMDFIAARDVQAVIRARQKEAKDKGATTTEKPTEETTSRDSEDDYMLATPENRQEATPSAETRQKSLHLLHQLLPQLGSAGVRLVDGMIEIVDNYGNSVEAFGRFTKGIIEISKMSPIGTEWHEAFHYVTHMLLTSEERLKMFNEAANKWGIINTLEIEEKLAEDFRLFMRNQMDTSFLGGVRRLFSKLKNAIRTLFKGQSAIQQVFYDVYKGRMAGRKVNNGKNFYEDMAKFRRDREAMLKNKYAYKNLSNEDRRYLELRGISREDYELMIPEVQEATIRC